MGAKYWIVRFLKFLIPVTAGLFVIYMIKGYSLENAFMAAILWGVLTSSVFTASRIYYVWQGIHCEVCNDLPADQNKESDNSPETRA